jgi:hypothetical protein
MLTVEEQPVTNPLIAERLLQVIDEGRRTATYKLALLMALIDACATNSDAGGRAPSSLQTREIARHVLRVYLPHARSYLADTATEPITLRQITNKNSAVMGAVLRLHLIGESSGHRTLRALEQHHPGEVDRCLNEVERTFASAVLQLAQTRSQGGRKGRPGRAEQVGAQPFAFQIQSVQRRDHAHPVQLDQRTQQRCESQQLVARTRPEAHHAAVVRVERAQRHRLGPVDVVEERPVLAADHLQQSQRVAMLLLRRATTTSHRGGPLHPLVAVAERRGREPGAGRLVQRSQERPPGGGGPRPPLGRAADRSVRRLGDHRLHLRVGVGVEQDTRDRTLVVLPPAVGHAAVGTRRHVRR